eukprot:2062499-Amphidinium_carterae.3
MNKQVGGNASVAGQNEAAGLESNQKGKGKGKSKGENAGRDSWNDPKAAAKSSPKPKLEPPTLSEEDK